MPTTGRGNYPNISSWARYKGRSRWSSQARKTVRWGDKDFADQAIWQDWYFDVVSGSNTYTHVGTGGIVFAGDGGIAKLKRSVAVGGITLDGQATVLRRKVPVSSGGISFEGSASISKRKMITPIGGIVLEGSALVRKIKSIIGSGEIVFAGTATKDFIPGPPASSGARSRIGTKWSRNQN